MKFDRIKIKNCKCKPGVPRKDLFLAASAFWLLVALKLLSKANGFFAGKSVDFWIIGTGVIGIIPFYYFVFKRVSLRYILRIKRMTIERPCLFSFFDYRGYLLIGFMIGLGVLTSRMSFIPDLGLNTFFISLGGALLISSARFFKAFLDFRTINQNE